MSCPFQFLSKVGGKFLFSETSEAESDGKSYRTNTFCSSLYALLENAFTVTLVNVLLSVFFRMDGGKCNFRETPRYDLFAPPCLLLFFCTAPDSANSFLFVRPQFFPASRKKILRGQ